MIEEPEAEHVWWKSTRDGLCHAVSLDQAKGTRDGMYDAACTKVLTESTTDKRDFPDAERCPYCLSAMGEKLVAVALALVMCVANGLRPGGRPTR
ncbi:hypothetical protein [Goodfellowiella coeruleoviolacea]|uniref:Uncharacterized protein n=1 Tax=Goodfellowiella coeruleoviolacea TaxID=334858 RepID=A0AAE3GMU1_9PSEU|nr:hypothetical protein [Goodfellowiella coeruleoviolacea]MCP2168883.1 hypothetical protein [Goodfellowiella coeruleoviolacea]